MSGEREKKFFFAVILTSFGLGYFWVGFRGLDDWDLPFGFQFLASG